MVGASGKLGATVCSLIDSSEQYEVSARIGSKDDLDGMSGADIVVDVTLPAITQEVVAAAVERGIPVVVGTSGWSADRIETLRRGMPAEGESGVLIVPNFSIGSVLATSFAAMAARYFDSIEIVEAHPVSKVDSPSGTAVRTAELIGGARGARGPVVAPHVDQRARGQHVSTVPIHSLRMEGVVAKQEVLFGGIGELLTVTHETIDRSAYEAGILLALGAVRDIRGVVVGLDKLIELTPDTEE